MQLTNDNTLQNSEKQSADSWFPVLTKENMRSLMLANSSFLPQRTGLVNFLGYKKLHDNIKEIHSMLCLNLWLINTSSIPFPSSSFSIPQQDCAAVSLYLQADSYSLLLNKTAFSWNKHRLLRYLAPSTFFIPPQKASLQGSGSLPCVTSV